MFADGTILPQALVLLLAQGTGRLEAHLPSTRPERVAALEGLLPAQRTDGDGAAYNLTGDPSPIPLGTSQATVGFRAFLGYKLPDR